MRNLVLETTGKSLGIELEDEISGKLSLNWGTIQADEKEVSLKINYRYPVTRSYEDCAPILEKAFAEAGFSKLDERHKASLYVPEDSELVQKLMKVYKENTGDEEAKPKSIGGGTYAKSDSEHRCVRTNFPGR